MGTRQLDTELFGRSVEFNYSETWIGYSLLSLRLIMGWTFFLPGIRHLWNPEWSAQGLLLYGIPDGNPLTGLWTTLGNDWVWLLTPLNSIGLTLVGLALILGVFVRFSAFAGSLMMAFYWAAEYPFENAIIVDYHFVYIFILFGLGALGVGRILGLDAKLEKLDVVQKYPRLRLLLG